LVLHYKVKKMTMKVKMKKEDEEEKGRAGQEK
jgi:hypothetical protein